ncbi:MAG: isoprenylcysteine carboxylmethyltransferase family protein [Zoogloeaceae bacterium]|jgi:protein-S-isoprenylcysteine O-methyltransferase Ste14|nr:isoprenylcysteine carboxylmethyltransferase family protein [Zoogloeaceae bacterium]
MNKAWVKAILLLPFSVLVVVPSLVLYAAGYVWPGISLVFWALGLPLALFGLSLAVCCMRLFATHGEGTPAPWDPPRKLVRTGPYRYVRNPMILSVLILLLAEAALLGSGVILLLFLIFFLGKTLYFVLWEEKELEERFGEDYLRYKRHVPRWIPRTTAWDPETT